MDILSNLDFSTAFKFLVPSLKAGLWVVVQATVFGFFLAIILGLFIAIGRISKIKILRGFLLVFLEFIRGTPLLVQLVYMYYVVPLLVSIIVQIWNPGYQFKISSLVAGTIGLGINYGCYISEVIRSSILSIDGGQTEAALALGLTNNQTMFRIIIPQALRNVIPVFGNYLVMMLKDTSLLAYVSVSELLLRTQSYASQSFLTIESYTILAGFYLILSLPLAQLVKLVEKKMLKFN
ncbi:amino acid ABC transporter permease [Clostridium beijerinckii]|jgi:polar amino acid transport system permease protein|uniref:Amino acid ABC transporter permease n=2 Tax=Clostridium beijerinckii TaxID=1520 RepID=A0A0B5QT16_CLOBE|nr:amino acid ABC transporter permease [Clostridium beijerinckii]ABR36459.1 polar amino acid ABC transporter, inner membrane subunit [Clostridium beijerinckii NCIMB 8052]AIU04522.1 polar amino acid ABC transporter, inner membrane subunit [Clostridium beijerinckii ATCC 35702]AJH01402.1 polar amino acid ABC transporter permease [Clostridium beijerinckii]MBA8932967.1 polar amino acid transport system permease protein [Clostridium beijerinckii]MBF7808893.1 amino acid ABC transporter permease [Clos